MFIPTALRKKEKKKKKEKKQHLQLTSDSDSLHLFWGRDEKQQHKRGVQGSVLIEKKTI